LCLRCLQSVSLNRFFLFFHTLLRQPRPTLFPYTTLFRSQDYGEVTVFVKKKSIWGDVKRVRNMLSEGLLYFHVAPDVNTETLLRDRKSTRLNSSHVSISYAVFCLKKKNSKKQNKPHCIKN